MPTTTQPCTIDWLVIPAPDIERAREFYGAIFGFTFTELRPGFHLFETGGTLHGALDADRAVAEQGVVFSITVPDLEAALVQAADLGATQTKEITGLGPGNGRYAAVRDPNGVEIEIYHGE